MEFHIPVPGFLSINVTDPKWALNQYRCDDWPGAPWRVIGFDGLIFAMSGSRQTAKVSLRGSFRSTVKLIYQSKSNNPLAFIFDYRNCCIGDGYAILHFFYKSEWTLTNDTLTPGLTAPRYPTKLENPKPLCGAGAVERNVKHGFARLIRFVPHRILQLISASSRVGLLCDNKLCRLVFKD
jgi:hypothetical protein